MSGNGHVPGMRRPRRAAPVVTLALAAVVVAAALAVALSRTSGPRSIQDRVHAIAAGFRCPICGNLSVADSTSTLAQQMRADITARLRAGQTPAQVRAFFVSRYGRWLLLTPGGGGLAFLVWALPVTALVVGAGGILVAFRRRGRAPPASEATSSVTAEERARIRAEVAALEEPE